MKRAVLIAVLLLCAVPASASVPNCSLVGDTARQGRFVTGKVRLTNTLSGIEAGIQAELQAFDPNHHLVGNSQTDYAVVSPESRLKVPFKIRVGRQTRVRSVVITNCAVRIESQS